ncbi:hypothetical protein [Streptomyces sp. NPDC047130]|uniref:hypothetical protein n=1 Tax=Streptomyces sp. NPDC047130 TaxID=3155261 RepID=UPI0033C9F956
MPRWAVLRAKSQTESFRYTVQREFEGTEEEAMAEMLRIVDTYEQAAGEAGRRRQRRRVFRLGERSYFVGVDNLLTSREAVFTLAEIVADTHDDDLPDTATG